MALDRVEQLLDPCNGRLRCSMAWVVSLRLDKRGQSDVEAAPFSHGQAELEMSLEVLRPENTRP